jgi:Tfp pilus assembly protein PilO
MSTSPEIARVRGGFMPQVRYRDEFIPRKPIEMFMSGDYKKLMTGFTDNEKNIRKIIC